MNFCYLEKDRKTFEYFKEYLQYLDTSNKNCLYLDNKLQIIEMENHLNRNGYNSNDLEATIEWVKNNAEGFRSYLNTIKLVYIVWKCMGNNWENFNWESFVKIEDNINNLKSKCLDTIF